MVENLELGTFSCLTDLGIKAEHRLNLQHSRLSSDYLCIRIKQLLAANVTLLSTVPLNDFALGYKSSRTLLYHFASSTRH